MKESQRGDVRNNRRLPRFAKNNIVGIIVGVKRDGKRKMDEPSVEVGVKESSKKKLMRSTWASYVENER